MVQIPDFPMLGGYLPTSFLDWEGHVVAVVFVSGCNFRCPFCHNAPLATGMAEGLSTRSVLSDIWRRRLFLDGVVISGGEPTLYPNLQELLEWIRKKVEIPVKLDTNGSRPEILERLFRSGLVDAVAMDVKGPWEKYSVLSGVPVETDRIRASIGLLKAFSNSYELRTTFVPGLLTIEDMKRVQLQLEEDPRWVVQLFRPENPLDPSLRNTPPPSKAEIASALPGVKIRG